MKLIYAIFAFASLLLISCSYIEQFRENPTGTESPLFEIVKDDVAVQPPETEVMEETVVEEIVEQVMEKESDFTVVEGETVKIQTSAQDPDGDALTYIFEEPLDVNGRWITKVGDAGTYPVTVTVTDGKTEAQQQITITVTPLNHPPMLERIPDVLVEEGSTVFIDAKATDQDGDSIKITFGGWMTSDTKETDFNDAGTYKVIVTASDGKVSVSQDVQVVVRDINRAPVIESITLE